MFLTPYETTGLRNVLVTKIRSSIEQEITRDELSFDPIDDSLTYANDNLLTINDAEATKHIPMFTQPLLININPVRSSPDDNRFIVDCRGFVSSNREGMLALTKPAQYRNQLICGALTSYWYFEGHTELHSISKFATKVFANWITGTLASKLNLDELSQVRTSAIVAYYYVCLYFDFPNATENYTLSEDEVYTIALRVAYATGLKSQDAIDMIKDIPTMRDVNDLIVNLRRFGGSDRLNQINTAMLYTLLGRFAINGMPPDTVLAAVEYPPLFLSIIYVAATERGYNKSAIGNIVHNLRNLSEVKSFVTEVSKIVQGDK